MKNLFVIKATWSLHYIDHDIPMANVPKSGFKKLYANSFRGTRMLDSCVRLYSTRALDFSLLQAFR